MAFQGVLLAQAVLGGSECSGLIRVILEPS